jgi:hypothetical protein
LDERIDSFDVLPFTVSKRREVDAWMRISLMVSGDFTRW